MATTTVGVKLDDETRARLKELGRAKQRSTHWMVKEAVARYVEVEERYEREKAEDLARWERYVETGHAVPHETVTAWLDGLAAEADRRTVVDVDDLDGVGKLLVGQVPDPGGAVAEDDLSGGGDEAAPLRLAMGALGEGGRLRVGVAAGRALNGGVVADRPRVAARPALGVAPFGRPRRRQHHAEVLPPARTTIESNCGRAPRTPNSAPS